jgi:DNA-binding FadR family transcriptional regulator
MKPVQRGGAATRAVTLSQRVMDALGAAIVRGRFAPGQTLPTEPDLGARLGVSRTPLREAVKKLHGKGLIEIGRKNGTRVRPSCDWHQLDPDVLRWRLQSGPDDEILRQLYELRAAIEPEACRYAALNGSAEDHAAITTAFARMEACGGEIAAVVKADVQFHLAIVKATRNIFYAGLASAIGNALETAFVLGAKRRTFPAEELEQHRQVMRAITSRRGDLAAARMRALLGASRRSTLQETRTEVTDVPARTKATTKTARRRP